MTYIVDFNKKWIIVFLFLITLSASAQTIHFQSCDLSTGLSSSNVKCVLEDGYGFIWMGTQDGVTRFDGVRSRLFNTPVLDGNDVSRIYFDPTTNLVWVSYSRGGINAIDARTLEIRFSLQGFNCYQELRGTAIRGLCTDARGGLWIGTEEGLYLMSSIRKDSLVRIQVPGIPLLQQRVIQVSPGYNGHILATISGSGVLDIEPIHYQSRLTAFDRPAIVYQVSDNDSMQTLTISTSVGVYFYDIQNRTMQHAQSFYSMPVHADTVFSAVKKRGQFFISTQEGLFKIHPKGISAEKIEFRPLDKPDLQNIATNLLIDRSAHLWVGTMAGCYFASLTSTPFQQVTRTTAGNPANHLYFLDDYQGRLLACDETGLYRLNPAGNRLEICDSPQDYHYFFSLPDGRRVCSRQGGLFLWDDRSVKAGLRLDNVFSELRPLHDATISASVTMGDSLMLLAGFHQSGIYAWHVRTHRLDLIDSPVAVSRNMGEVFCLTKISDREVMIGTGTYLLTYNIYSGKWRDIGSFLGKKNYFFDVLPLRNSIYVASYGGGITRLDTNCHEIGHYTMSDGLSNNCIYKILAENDSVLWASSNNGLNRIDVLHGRITAFYQADGLHTNEFEQYSGTRLAAGMLCFGGLRGLTIIHPGLYHPNLELPVVYLNSFIINTSDSKEPIQSDDPKQTLFPIPSSWQHLELSFSALHFTNPTRVSYQYRVLQKDSSWSPLPAGKVTLIGLQPGLYEVQVKASNEDGLWSAPISVYLDIAYKWYETAIFHGFVLVLIAAMLYGVYRYRIYQINQKIQLRKEIAADLHDDIGSTLHSIRVFTRLAEINQTSQYYEQIKLSVREASAGLRDMIWVLDDEDDSLHLLLDRLQNFARPVCLAMGIRFHLIAEESIQHQALSKRQKKNLLMILKESVNNAIKYSGCTEIKCSSMTSKGKMIFEVSDNGCGFDLASRQGSGNGLKNLQNRATQIGGRFDIHTAIGEGTCIRISF